MQRHWVHPEYQLLSTPVPRGRILSSKTVFRPFTEADLYCTRRPHYRGPRAFTVMVSALSLLLVAAFSSLAIRSGSVSLPEIGSFVATNMNTGSWLASGKESVPADGILTDEKAAGQVIYIADLIKGRTGGIDPLDLAMTIVIESRRSHIDPLFVAAVIKSESSFRTHARSYAGAVGLMQLLPGTGRYISQKKNLGWHGSSRLTDPEYNLRLGVAYLKYLHEQFRGNLEHTLIAYNWGPAKLNDALSRRGHIPSSTVKYARTIISNHKKWKRDLDSSLAKNLDSGSDLFVG